MKLSEYKNIFIQHLESISDEEFDNELKEAGIENCPTMGRTERYIGNIHHFVFGDCTDRDFNMVFIISILLGITIAETLIILKI